MLHPSDDMAVRTWIASLDEEGILPMFMRVCATMRRRKSKEGEEPLSDVERSVCKREGYVRSENERQQTAVDDGDALMKQ